MSAADEIRRIRKELGLTQAEAAEQIWGDRRLQSTLSDLERGVKSPTWETLERIADALDCDLELLFVPRDQASADVAANILRALEENGPMTIFELDRWFAGEGLEGFSPDVLEELEQGGEVVLEGRRYRLR